MAKTKTPFLSLGARGTIGGVLTAQRALQGTILRKKPIPSDPFTDNQRWHRHLYLVLCQYWNGLSLADKQVWRSAAARYHLTGLNLFLKTELKKLPDLQFFYPLSEGQGSIAQDFTGKRNHATIFGASWLPGVFDTCLHFDGINDYVLCPNIDLTADKAILCYIYPRNWVSYHFIFDRCRSGGIGDSWGESLYMRDHNLRWRVANGAKTFVDIAYNIPALNTWYTVLAVHRLNAGQIELYVGDDLKASSAISGYTTRNIPIIIGRFSVSADYWWDGEIDEPALIFRNLTTTEISIYSNRQESP